MITQNKRELIIHGANTVCDSGTLRQFDEQTRAVPFFGGARCKDGQIAENN
jgi:hypothetical protein